MRIMLVVPKAPYGEDAKVLEFGVFDIRENGIVDCLLTVSDVELETTQLAYSECQCKKLVSTEFSPYTLEKLDELAIQGPGDELIDIYDFCGVPELKVFITPSSFIENSFLTDRNRSDVMKALDTIRECEINTKDKFIIGIISNTMLKLQYAVTNNTITFEFALQYLDNLLLLLESLRNSGSCIPTQVLEDLRTIYTCHRSQWRTYFSTFLLHAIRDLKG